MFFFRIALHRLERNMKFVFTCGGTAGHVNPALAVAGRLRELMPDCEILFIGAEGKMEMELVPRAGYEIKGLRVTNLSRGKSLDAVKHNIETIHNVLSSCHEAGRLLKEFKPDAVIGTGGYVCYPVITEAAMHKIPTVIHESNAVPGLTTKLLAEHVKCIMVGFKESRSHYGHPERVKVTGTPVRGEFKLYDKAQAKRELGMRPDEKLVVSVWGSLGAGHMNKVMSRLIPMLNGREGFRLIHAAGRMYYENFIAELSETAPDYEMRNVEVREYIHDMPRVMAAADLIMCRAGASTISELCYLGKPSIVVPSPNVTNNHQEKNARVLEAEGGAIVRTEGEFDAESLLAEMKGLLSDEARLSEMARNMKRLAVPEATDRICGIILGLCEQA